jgi:hypothetical protein
MHYLKIRNCYLSTHLYRSEFNTLITSNSTNEKARPSLISCSQYGMGIHFAACPKSNTWSICSDDEFNISISLRLGLPINGIHLFSKCNNCKSNSHLVSKLNKSNIFGGVTIINPCCDSNLSSSSLTPLTTTNCQSIQFLWRTSNQMASSSP